jgi:hypothetical protein
MSESKLNTVKVLNINLNEDESSVQFSESVNDLKKQGFEKIQVTIEGSIKDLLKKSGYSIELFERIRTKQDLPDWVIYDLFEVSGKLKGTNINNRLKNVE